jgi:hypothetical protein
MRMPRSSAFLSGAAHRPPLPWMLHQPKLLRLLPDLILIPAQHARRVRDRVAISERLREVCDIHFGPRLSGVCAHSITVVPPGGGAGPMRSLGSRVGHGALSN